MSLFERLLDSLRRRCAFSGPGRLSALRRAARYRSRWLSRAARALAGAPPRRLSVQIQTSSRCDGSCAICPYGASWHKAHPGRMSDVLYGRILAQLERFRLDRLCLYLENEPFLDPGMIERVRAARARLRFRCLELATNASALTEERARELAAALAGAPHEIRISFHGVDADSYERAMGLDFRRALRNVVGLLKVPELTVSIRGAGAAVPEIGGAASPTFTYAQMRAFWEDECASHGISRRPALDYIAYHDRAGAVSLGGREFRRRLFGFYCERADEWLHVLYNGDAILCCNDYRRETVIGNLREEDLLALLRGPAYRRYRLMVMGLRKAPPDFLCRRCTRPGG